MCASTHARVHTCIRASEPRAMHGMYSFPLRKYKRTKSLSFVSLKIASAPELHPSLVNTLRAHCLLLAPTFISICTHAARAHVRIHIHLTWPQLWLINIFTNHEPTCKIRDSEAPFLPVPFLSSPMLAPASLPPPSQPSFFSRSSRSSACRISSNADPCNEEILAEKVGENPWGAPPPPASACPSPSPPSPPLPAPTLL